jgi:hypothetical protein
VKPLYKKDDRNCISNCIPLSVLTSSQKSENVMYNKLLRHLNNNMLVEEQLAFRKYQTTKIATYELINPYHANV